MDIGPKLKSLFKHFGLRNIDVANRLEVSGGAVSNWFRFSTIEKENLAKVAAILRTTTEEILLLDVEDIIAKINARKESRMHLPSIPGPTREDFQRRAYTPEALNIAWAYDNLPSDEARLKVERCVADLEIGPVPALVKPARATVRLSGALGSTRRRPPSAPPSPKRRPKTRS